MQRLYLDTTVPSAYIDARAPDRQRLTEEFWLDRLPSYEPLISALVVAEIRDTPDSDKRRRLEALVQSFAVLPVTAEAEDLADEYVDRGVVRAKFRDDALHVALAVTGAIPEYGDGGGRASMTDRVDKLVWSSLGFSGLLAKRRTSVLQGGRAWMCVWVPRMAWWWVRPSRCAGSFTPN